MRVSGSSFQSLAAAGLVLAAAAAFAQDAPMPARLLPAGSEIVFTSRQMGVPVDGRFQRFDAQIAFDPKRPEASSVKISVDLASVSMAAAEVEAELAKPGWFDSRRQANASFQSTSVRSPAPGRLEVAGKLTLKGKVRELVVPVTLAPSASATVASGSFVLKRLQFNIGDGEWSDPSLVADDVQVRFKLSLAAP